MTDLSQFKVVRLNCDLFPITEYEQAGYDRYNITPIPVELSGLDILMAAEDCHGLMIVSEKLPADVIDRMSQCRIVSRLGAGTDKVDIPALTRNGIVLTNVPDFCYEEQADHAMALLLALVRHIPKLDKEMRAGRWDSSRKASRDVHRFRDRVLGLVGFGGSAKALARRAKGFGLKVIANRQRQVDDPVAAELGVTMTDLETVVRESDYLSLHLPLNEHTRGLFSAQRLAQMKKGAYFINTARGAIVDETALAAAVREGRLAGAGIDTFEEIYVHGPDGDPPKHPLLDLDNVIITPHTAAFSFESSFDVGNGCVENLAAVLMGKWPEQFRVVNGEVQPKVALS